ncbi:helix-turn-helix domain-containing protein [Mammaliicoccus sciuri]|uniref:helix-turn-helix domain-containing protein n=1 Tax=Mammaliicoccus sciuri TaxID=1296 RepID=UPI001E3852EC|nr:helix-turn-helix transcriptional regulator [Mammaliicoccus sciuri]MCD8845835.1 helix-turn-helix domain-containing protein [Mammaliicoccus sciuri]
MQFGELMEKYRVQTNLSLNKLADLAGVSPGYISKLKNNTSLIPSEEVVFKIAMAFQNNGLKEDEIKKLLFFLITDPKYIKKMNNIDFNVEFESKEQMVIIRFASFLQSEIDKLTNTRNRLGTLFLENKIISKKKSSEIHLIEDVVLNYPIFDIEWIFKQEKYELFYGREFHINDGQFYNVIDTSDKKMISNIIRTYFKSKYEKVDNVYERTMKELEVALNNAEIKDGDN